VVTVRAGGGRRTHTEVWWRNLLENVHLEDQELGKEIDETGAVGNQVWRKLLQNLVRSGAVLAIAVMCSI